MCLLTLFTKIKFSRKFLNLHYSSYQSQTLKSVSEIVFISKNMYSIDQFLDNGYILKIISLSYISKTCTCNKKLTPILDHIGNIPNSGLQMQGQFLIKL